jgi:hypothetical protein
MSKVSLDKELVRASVDVEAVYNELLNQTPATRDGRNLTYLCPFHTDERTPNLKATTSDGPSRGSYRCFACGEKGDLFSFWMNVKGVGFQKALKALAERTGLPTNSKSKKRQKASKKAVTCDLNHDFEKWPQDLKRWLEGRGITAESVQRYSLAHALYQSRNHALAIPYGDPHKDGYCKLRFYRDDYLHKFATWPSGRPQRLFGLPIEKDTVLLCEGELDTIRLAQEPTGASVLSVPNGAETFKPEWAEELQGKHVAIIFDRDEAGRKGAERAARMLCGSAASVRIVELPEGFKDVTEYLQGSHDGTDIMLLVKDAPEFEPPRTTEVIQGDEALPSLEELQEIITTELGEGYYQTTVACMSTAAALLLADNQNPPSLNLVGPPSSVKTTVLGFFYNVPGISYKTDSFTPASFVTHSSNIKTDQLEEIDLLPRIRHKVMVVPELAPIFGKAPDALLENFSILVRVFDGQGLETDSGSRGRRGYSGDYLFAWLGATTPVPNRVWKVMGKLGSRFLFYQMPVEKDGESQIDGLTESLLSESSFDERLARCRDGVRNFMEGLWDRNSGVRGVTWDRKKDDPTITKHIVRLAQFVAIARSEVNVWKESDTKGYSFNQPIIEQPERLANLLLNLARGHALLHGRDGVSRLDMPMVVKVALSSMPDDRRGVIEMLLGDVETPKGQAKASEIEKQIKVSRPTAHTIMERLKVLGLVDLIEGVGTEGKSITLLERFNWFLSNEFDELRLS